MLPVSVFNLPNAHLDVFRSTPSRRRDERRGTEPLSPLTWWSPKYILWDLPGVSQDAPQVAGTASHDDAHFRSRIPCSRALPTRGCLRSGDPQMPRHRPVSGRGDGVVDDLLGRIQHENMAINRHDAQATRAYIQYIHGLLQQTRTPGGGLRGADPTAGRAPFRHGTPIGSGPGGFYDTAVPLLGARLSVPDYIHPSGEIDFYTDSPKDYDRLARHGKAWTWLLPHHKRVQDRGRRGHYKGNDAKVPDTYILHVDWAGSNAVGKKRKGSLMVSLHRAEDANRLLRGLFYLRSQTLRTELFDPSGRLTQCLQCQRYGHVQRGCTFSIRCLYCGEQHRKGDCPQTKVTPDRFTCATCKGPNLAYEKMCPTRLQAAAEADYTRKHKPKYFPEPARPVTSLPIGPPPLTSNPSGDSEQPEEPEPEPAESSAETRKKAKKVVETSLTTTPTPLPEGAKRNLRRRATTYAHEVCLVNSATSDHSESTEPESDQREPSGTISQADSSEQSEESNPSGRSDTDAPSAPKNSELDRDANLEIPDREEVQQCSALDTDTRPEQQTPISPFSSPKKRRSTRLQEEPIKRRKTTGLREIPQPTPEQWRNPSRMDPQAESRTCRSRNVHKGQGEGTGPTDRRVPSSAPAPARLRSTRNATRLTGAYTAPLQGPSGLEFTAQAKAKLLSQVFFPPPPPVNLDDIRNYKYPEPLQNPGITQSEMLQSINRPREDKDPCPDDITDRFLQVTADLVALILTEIYNESLRQVHCPAQTGQRRLLETEIIPAYRAPKHNR
ncbi:hypothetical protein AFLA70_306g000980 [Aspergillus flavus AF70]|nr:hypothetical protein AFLA70_306g000980 [Aspergillus flavus AF70]